MKRCKVIAVVLMLLLTAVCTGCALLPAGVTVSADVPDLPAEFFCLSNQHQWEADAWLGVYGGQLYYLPQCNDSMNDTAFDGWLCVLEDGQLVKLCRPAGGERVRIIGQSGCFLYYYDIRNGDDGDRLYCYDLPLRRETLLATTNLSNLSLTVFAEDGSLYIPLYNRHSGEPHRFLHIQGDRVLSDNADAPGGIALGNRVYATAGEGVDFREKIVCTDESGLTADVPLPVASYRTLLPAGDGLLIHNAGYSQLLFRISPDHEVTPVFSAECMSSSTALAVTEDSAYLSLKRYAGYNDIFLRRYENDAVEGTYHISLTDFTPVKISDAIYSGLYFFGGDYLLACDESCSVYVLNLDGSVRATLIYVQER
ncbi:MAG: hypothetical protein IJE07_10440 [Clostridia bacterium]|nr:hypothetical protein [Clostridia bacterium]